MLEAVFGDQFFWQLIGAILALATLVVSIVALIQSAYKKSLSYRVMAQEDLLRELARYPRPADLRIFLGNEPVENITQIMIKVINDGKVPITKSDFEYPLAFQFKGGSKILYANVLRDSPKNIAPTFKCEVDLIVFEPKLLNSENSFWIEIWLSDLPLEIICRGHVVGVKEIKNIPSNINWIYKERRLIGIFALTLLALIGLATMFLPIGARRISGIFILFLVGVLWKILTIRKYHD